MSGMLLQFTIQLALMGFAEFVLHLSRMNPDMMYLHQDCGYLNIAYFKFDIDDTSGKIQAYWDVCDCVNLNIAYLVCITVVFMPPPFKEWWRGIKCYPCPCVRPFVRPL